ncbi:LPD1 domain-containing protein [Sutcliffiella cohnii]|uniref:LPD1 domain-containing protein n=1 Tax=Sutcliffiella cohnii TaxID=33932 RepID=UPI00082A0CBA|nr:LPD1 domain-containing protein [Sutcliffiella cohnii]
MEQQQISLFENPFNSNPTDIRTDVQEGRKISYDVGEEIAGSRKSEAALRHLFATNQSVELLEEIEGNSAVLAAELISKQELFADFSLEKERENGVDVMVARLKQLLIQRIDSQPSDSPTSRKEFLQATQELKRRFNKLKLWEEFSSFIDLMNNQFRYEGTNPTYTKKRLEEMLHEVTVIDRSKHEEIESIRKKIKLFRERLDCINDANQWNFSVLGTSFKNFFTKQASINSTLKSVSNLKDWDELLKTKKSSSTGNKKKPVWERELPERPDRIGGRPINVTKPEDMLRLFMFRGIQFGHYVNDDKAFEHIFRCSEALYDLADVLNIHDYLVSLNSDLAIAFGARGRGKALAHYEPKERVINFTKDKGTLGVTAHEWFHALDHFLFSLSHSHKNGKIGYLSDLKDIGLSVSFVVKDSMEKLLEEIKTGTTTSYFFNENKPEANWRISYSLQKLYQEKKGDLLGIMTSYKAKLDDSYRYHLSMISYIKERDETEKIEKRKMRELKKYAQALAWFHEKKTGERVEAIPYPSNKSLFLQQAISLDRGKEGKYWSSDRELTARAFEAWVHDKLREQGRRSDYLVCGTNDSSAYPSGEERVNINKKIDSFIDAVTKNILF